MRLAKHCAAFAALCMMLTSVPAMAQSSRDAVVIPPTTNQNFVLEKIGLDVIVDGQKAKCTLKYVIYNPGNRDIEVDFLAPLPEGGTVTGLVLFDGKQEMKGNVYNKDEALKIYQQIVSALKDPALLEYAGRDTFRARIFPVPANGRQTLELRFDYLVPKNDGQLAFSFPIAGPMTQGREPLQDIHVVIKNSPSLSGIYSPIAGTEIKHKAGEDATIAFQSENAPAMDLFRLFFKTDAGPMGGLVLSHKPEKDEDGFFLFLADPALTVNDKDKVAKNVIFVLDKSGSMSGSKFKQATDALQFILERLDDRDSFNLVDYNGSIASWKPELMNMNADNRRSAQTYIDNLRAGGMTNIEGALKTSFKMINDPNQPNYIIFLTDGQPTEGEQNEMKLAEIAKTVNINDKARLFSFGVGYDVNARLLDRLSGQAGGTSVFVKPDENLEASVSSFFAKITTPALTRPALTGTLNTNRVLPEVLPDIFTGQQLVVVGRYPKGGETSFTLTGRNGDKTETYTYKVNLANGPTDDGQFIASLWAQRRIGELLDQIDMKGGQPPKELMDELVELSKKYGVLTPYTSFLALEDQTFDDREKLSRMATENIQIMNETVGQSANFQREVKGDLKMAQAPAPTKSSGKDSAAFEMMASMDKQVAQSGTTKMQAPNNWANQTFFYKNNQWQAENVIDADLKNATNIKQLSDEYFELAKELKPEEMVWMTQKEPVVFNHNGKIYLIEPVGNN